MSALFDRVEAALGHRPSGQRTLAGGCVGEVWRIDFADGQSLVAKTGNAASQLDVEGAMLAYLTDQSELPVPAVYLAEQTFGCEESGQAEYGHDCGQAELEHSAEEAKCQDAGADQPCG